MSGGLEFTSDPTVSETHLLRLMHVVLVNRVFVVLSWGQDLCTRQICKTILK